MKKTAFICLLAAAAGCNNSSNEPAKSLPAPGTIVAKDEMPVASDTLNHFTFSVQVVADSSVSSGVYGVKVAIGPNKGESKFTMPKGGEHLVPVMKRGAGGRSFIIGFKVPNDTAFYDYYEVTSLPQGIRMDYLKSYSF